MKIINFNPDDFEPVRRIAMEFPNAADSLSHSDTPSVKIKKNLLCRIHENGEWIVIRTDFEHRAIFLEQYPESCFITPHYQDYPYICVHVNSFSLIMIKEILEAGYQAITNKKKK
jgi:hypothetical protein